MYRNFPFRHSLYCLLAFALIPAAFVQRTAAEVTIEGFEEIVFTKVEKRLIEEFFAEEAVKVKEGKGMPPGLAKRKVLPPGLAKRDLPAGLESKLPEGAPGTVRQIVDGDVVLLEKATGRVLDILVDVIKSE